MYIDFHTHGFAEAIAKRAISSLEDIAGNNAHTRGTVEELIKVMDVCGVDKSVLLTIATKPKQQKTINDWAASVKSDRILPFGSVHPDAEDALTELERIKSLGLYGVKLHPDYQHFCVDEEKLIPIYKKAGELDLPVLFHSGFDAVAEGKYHCDPERALKVHRLVPEMTMILAHMGGVYVWDDVEKYLLGEDIYLDLSYVAGRIPTDQLNRIVSSHSSERFLAASDMPWQYPSETKLMINSLNLSQNDKDNICFKNANRILHLD